MNILQRLFAPGTSSKKKSSSKRKASRSDGAQNAYEVEQIKQDLLRHLHASCKAVLLRHWVRQYQILLASGSQCYVVTVQFKPMPEVSDAIFSARWQLLIHRMHLYAKQNEIALQGIFCAPALDRSTPLAVLEQKASLQEPVRVPERVVRTAEGGATPVNDFSSSEFASSMLVREADQAAVDEFFANTGAGGLHPEFVQSQAAVLETNRARRSSRSGS